MRIAIVFATALLGCSVRPAVHGAGVMLSVQPQPPGFSGSYDFDVLGPVKARGCVARHLPRAVYWVHLAGVDLSSTDVATRRAIGAAAFEAVTSVEGADTLLVTRIVSVEAKGEVCATVFGRAVRVRKASASLDTERSQPSANAEHSDVPGLTPSLIAETIKTAMPVILQCATFEQGELRVSITVAPNGRVTAANAVIGGTADLRACVLGEVKKLMFPPSRAGATFVYPFKL